MINLAELGTKMARCAPGAPALIDADRGLSRTFGQLSARVDCLAVSLVNMFGAGQRIAVLSENCLELFELYLASAASGSLLFPLNWRFSPSQVREALLDADPVIVFYADDYAGVIDEVKADVNARAWVRWNPGADSEYEELLRRAAGSGADPEDGPAAPAADVLPDPESLLHSPYLAISTGGTTGIPKNAVHTQYSYGACALNYLAAARIAPTDVYLMLGQLFHVVGYMPLAYLAMGRPVVIADFDEDRLVEVIAKERVSGFFAIATMLPRLVRAARDTGADMSSVRQVEYGGAPMGEEVIREAAQVFGADLVQAWGMTELGPGTYLDPEAHRRAFAGEQVHRLRSCGRGTMLGTVAVLDEDGNPVPRDNKTMGEICHRGPGNMVGYWNKPEETAELLRDGWVHSGDGGTWDEDGYVFIVDRIKSMIISGGENIFPGEIERVLGNHPKIAEVVVIGVPDKEWGEVVKAVVVPVADSGLTAEDVSDHVGRELAKYKRPRIVEFVESIPSTPTGKVDRKALREAVGSASAIARVGEGEN
jgi:acyl-CoA synthetase (AMP-forming)/AMP-acid ligase II